MKYILLILLVITAKYIFASPPDTLRAELSGLLKQRQILFDQYSNSLNKKSGIFGNKTKNDLRDSQARLKEIVEADNKIMSVLNRTVDFRNFEKQNLTYNASSYAQRIQNLSSLNETLLKQNKICSDELTNYKASTKKYRLYNILWIALVVAVIAFKAIRKHLHL